MPETPTVTLEELVRRFLGVPHALQSTLEQELVLDPSPPGGRSQREAAAQLFSPSMGFDVTGVGASEFPARILVEALSGAGIRAQFRPISTYLGSPAVPQPTSLVVFSQGLSPNARLPFRKAAAYQGVHLFTSVEEGRSDDCDRIFRLCASVHRHLPGSEGGTLLRVVGPACSALLALRWAAGLLEERQLAQTDEALLDWTRWLKDVPRAYERASIDAPPLGTDPAGCLASGRLVPLAAALMWKWQEALYTRLPPVFDILSFAHGPLQSFVGKEALFLALGSPDTEHLLPALHAPMNQERHRLHLLSAHLPDLLAIFEYDAQVAALALREMQLRGLSPGDWPGKAAEIPLYELGRELGER